MSIEVQMSVAEVGDDGALLTLEGEVDMSNCASLRDAFVRLLDQGRRFLIVRLDAVTFIDSSGLGVLIGGLKRTQQKQGGFALVCVNQRVLKELEIVKLTKVFQIFQDVDSACQAAASPRRGSEGGDTQ